MPTYEVAAPDGTKYQATVPSGTSPADVLAYVQKQHAQPAPQPQPQQAPGDAAFAAGRQAGAGESGLAAGLDQAARQYLPLGLGTDVGAAARYVGQRVSGVKNPDTFATDLAYSGGQSQGETEGSPTASTIGGVTGVVGQAAALTPLLRAALPFKSALALKTAAQGGSKLGNAAKLLVQGAAGGATLGAATGAVQGGINGGQPSATGAVEGATGSGVAGAVEGAAGGLAAAGLTAAAPATAAIGRRMLGSLPQASQDGIAALSKAFSLSPTDLSQARAQFRLDTGGTHAPDGTVTGGRDPALGELTDLYNRGELHAMVGKNPILGAGVANAANDSAASLPARLTGQMANTIGPGEDAADLVTARKTNMDRAMEPIRNQMIPIEPEDVEFLRGEVLPNSGLTQFGRRAVHADLDTGELSVGNADTLRQSLAQRGQANPGEGFTELSHGIRQLATDASDEYSAALNGFAQDSRYINGHAHGLTGKTPGQTADPGLIADLNTPEGRMGYQSGLATRYNDAATKSQSSAAATARGLGEATAPNANLENTFTPAVAGPLRTAAYAESRGLDSLTGIAPNLPKAQDGPNAGKVALAVVSHSLPVKIYHAIQAHLGTAMSDNVARITANYLTDPTMAQQGINLMRAHGVSLAQTQQILQRAGAAGAIAGVNTANQGQ